MLPEREIQGMVRQIMENTGAKYVEPTAEPTDKIMSRLTDVYGHSSVSKFEPKATDLSLVKPVKKERKRIP